MRRLFLRSSGLHFSVTLLVSGLLGILLSGSQLGKTVERETLDWRMRLAQGSRRPDTSVVIATIDQKSLTYFEKNGVAWPWPREFYGVLLDYFRAGGAKAVLFDMDFSQKDMDRLNVDASESDSSFGRAIRKAGNVVLITLLTRGSSDSATPRIDDRFFLRGAPNRIAVPGYSSCIAPRSEFQSGAGRLGAANYMVDLDGVARRIPLLYKEGDELLPQAALATFAVGNDFSSNKLMNFIRTIPVDENGYYLINWYGRGGPGGVFRYYSISALMISAVQKMQRLRPEISPSLFKGKYVIVGGTALGLMDYVSTPFTALEPFPGAEIHATILSNLLDHDFLRELSPWVVAFVILGMSSVVSGLFFGTKRAALSTAIALVLAGVYFLATLIVMSAARISLPLVGPEVSALGAFALAGVISYVTEGKRRRELRKLMNRYINSDVIEEISADPDTVDLKGREVEATVFFSDIRDFTSVSERLQPRELVESLNEYFNIATDIVLNSGAMLDKYIGDAIMAVFGAPLKRDDHAIIACLTAIKMQKVLTEFYSRRDGGKPVFQTRIGLNSGKMVIGNIGSERRTDYTAIGDSVNLASRLEGVNKQFGTRIMISESTFDPASGSVEARELDLVRVKGKDKPVRIFELLGEKGSLEPAQEEAYRLFHSGLQAYRRREWERSEAIFAEVLKLRHDDGPSLTYLSRCRSLASAGVPDDWDGVFTLKTK